MVRLPQLGAVESLNVSVAAGMLLYEAVRQRDGLSAGPMGLIAVLAQFQYPARPLLRGPLRALRRAVSPCRTPQSLATGGFNP